MSIDALIIINPTARAGDADLQQGLDLFRAAGWRTRLEQPEQPKRIPQLIRKYGPEVDRIIIGSGDGTLNQTAEALLEVKRPLGLIPLGTANDLARTLCVPVNSLEACRIILEGHLHDIDLGYVNEKYFFNVANIGLGELVTRRLDKDDKRRWGVFAYLFSFMDALKTHRSFRVQLTSDGRQESFSSIQVAVANGRHYGGGLTVAKEAGASDHLLHFVSLKPQGLFSIATIAPALHRGNTQDKEKIVFRQGREFEIRTRRPMNIVTDGELTTHTPARFTVVRNALSVYVPVDYEQNPQCE